jgi:hypothetical protein
MEKIADQAIRMRLNVDPEMGELYLRLAELANSHRRGREAMHLMRMGLMWETLMNSGHALSSLFAVQPISSAGGLPAEAKEEPKEDPSDTPWPPEVYPDLASLGLTAEDFLPPVAPSVSAGTQELNPGCGIYVCSSCGVSASLHVKTS